MKICTPTPHSHKVPTKEAQFSPKESTIQAILEFAAACNKTTSKFC